MSAFRTCRPLLVEAEKCEHSRTITTDTGFRHVQKGEWIITGEDGECSSTTRKTALSGESAGLDFFTRKIQCLGIEPGIPILVLLYVVDDAFFQRTFAPIQSYPWEQPIEESRNYGC